MKTTLLFGLLALLLTASTPAATLYVDAASTNPMPPYTNWLTAAAVIQDAVDAAQAGDEVVVTNGIYATGGRALVSYPLMTNRVYVARAITLRSVNGPEVTVIQGFQVPGTTNGNGAIRCVYQVDGATLSGFTLSNGGTRTNGVIDFDRSGGGVLQQVYAVVTNCVIRGNSAFTYAGGVDFGVIKNCTIISNTAFYGGGGTYGGDISNCRFVGNWAFREGGATWFGTIKNSLLVSNSSGWEGGAAYQGTLSNCCLIGNMATTNAGLGNSAGGGAHYADLVNCTVVGNSAVYGGGVMGSRLRNCIVCYNGGGGNHFWSAFTNCCTSPTPDTGINNTVLEPLFVDSQTSNFRLQTGSPCINTGSSAYATSATDADGRPRIVGTKVDMGAYEYQGAGMNEFIAWLAQFALPTGGSADYLDTDGDGANNWQEYRCATDPTNALSALRLRAPVRAGTNVTVRWPSVTNRSYFLEYSTNLTATPRFRPLATNIVGLAGTTSFTHTNATAAPFRSYRVGVP